MCGKFTAMASWREVIDFSQPLTASGRERSNDEIVTYRVMTTLPVIIWDAEVKARRIVPMRWSYPDPKNPARPKHFHVRSETIETTRAFANSFHDGQRGIVVFRTFNEGEEVGKKTIQYTIDPGDGIPRGFAFLWKSFDMPDQPAPLLACVMVTVPASKLISPITDRMPAILDDADWASWLGEKTASVDEMKATLRTVEDVNWKIAKEEGKPKTAK